MPCRVQIAIVTTTMLDVIAVLHATDTRAAATRGATRERPTFCRADVACCLRRYMSPRCLSAATFMP